MGCAASKEVSNEIREQNPLTNEDYYTHHQVFLTSSTYGALKLDHESDNQTQLQKQESVAESMAELKKSKACCEEPSPVIINAWELMKGIDEELIQFPKSPKSRVSPWMAKKRITPINGGNSPNLKKLSPKRWALSIKKMGSPGDTKKQLHNPFDPEFIQSFQKHFSEEEMKTILVSSFPPNQTSKLWTYPRRCPPGGENAVVIYTTTLRGIRKTFDDCNAVRGILEAQKVRFLERDISMHSGYKEELRSLMKEEGEKAKVEVPLVLVKGRLIGGVEVMERLEAEGGLGVLLEGIPKGGGAACGVCGGVGFVVCGACDGSCRVVGEDGRRSSRCGKCNENGLIICPLCT